MKKLIAIAVLLISIQGIAQPKERGGRMNNYTAEEIANLRSKKLTLELDLNKSQQDNVYKVILEEATFRKAKMEERKAARENGTAQKPTEEERLKMMNERLDRQIAVKKKMKSILNDEQYAKWQKIQEKMEQRGKRKKKGMRDK